MMSILQIIGIIFIAEILLFLALLVSLLLPDFHWYRKLKGGTWFYTTAKDCDGNVASWWTKHQPKTENILTVEFN